MEFQAEEFLEDVEPIELEIVGARPGDLALDLALADADSGPRSADRRRSRHGRGLPRLRVPGDAGTDGRPTLTATFDADLHASCGGAAPRLRPAGRFGLGWVGPPSDGPRGLGGPRLDLLDVDAHASLPGKGSA